MVGTSRGRRTVAWTASARPKTRTPVEGRCGVRLPVNIRARLRHSDRWRKEDMLRERPDLLREDPVRDMDLWRRMYLPTDHVRVGCATALAVDIPAAQYCWGCTW